MQIVVTTELEQRLIAALGQAGGKETGGIIMGQRLGQDIYQVYDLTIQAYGGTSLSFIRFLSGVSGTLRRFFRKTAHNYTHFNYLGEWHSHPTYFLKPSNMDSETMWDIVEDAEVGVNFAILMLVRLKEGKFIEIKAYLYTSGRRRYEVNVIREKVRKQ